MARILYAAAALTAALASSGAEEVGLDCPACLDEEQDAALSLLQHKKAAKTSEARVRVGSQPIMDCSGDSFFSCFDFFTDKDPTNGHVNYLDWTEASRFKLLKTKYNDSDSIYIGSFSGVGLPAMSVRLESKRTFTEGLFVLDVAHVPTGPGTWPAWWMHGDEWPLEGEFDMFECVNEGTVAKTSIHTSPGCVMPSVYGMDNGGDGNFNNAFDGSGVYGNFAGKKFNDAGGGLMAVWWLPNGFSMYHFPRNGDIPQDLLDDSPDPSSWGRPWRFFPFGSNCDAEHFKNMRLTLNLAFCGEWAGRTYPGGNDACVQYLNDNNVPDAHWVINSMKVYPIVSDGDA